MSQVRSFLRNAGVMGALSVVSRLGGLVQGALLARWLSPSGLGVLSVVSSTALSLYGMTRLGVDSTLHVSIAEGGPRRGAVMGGLLLVVLGAAALSAGICLVGAPWIAQQLYHQPALEPWIRWAALYVVAHFAYQYVNFAIAGFQRFASFARVNAAMTAVGVVAVPLAAKTFGTLGAVLATIAMVALAAALLGRHLHRAVASEGVRVRMDRWREGLAENMNIGFPHYLSALVAIPIAYALQGMLGRYGGTEALGVLRVTVSLSALITFIPTSIASATLSFLTQLRTDGARTDFDDLAALNTKAIWVVTMGLYLLMEPLLPHLIALLFGADYVSGTSAARLALVAAVMGAVEATNGQSLLARRLTRRVFVLAFIRVIVMGAVGWAVIPHRKVDGYVLADLMGITAAFVVAAVLNWTVVGHRRAFLVIVVLTVGLGLGTAFWDRGAFGFGENVFIGLGLGLGVCLVSLLGVFSATERAMLLAGATRAAAAARARWPSRG